MPAAPKPADELIRLRSLHALDVLDSAPEPQFDALARAASLVCGAPISFVTLIDADRQWMKARVGTELAELPRELSFCAHAILGDEMLEVPDATLDPRFADNPAVTGAPHVRFYAGAPLRLASGASVGTLCVLDTRPRQLDATQREVLWQLALAAAKALEARSGLSELSRVARAFEASQARFRGLCDSSPLGVFSSDANGRCDYANERMLAIFGMTPQEGAGVVWRDTLHDDDRQAVFAAWRHASLTCTELNLAHRIRRDDGSVVQVQLRARPLLEVDGSFKGFVGSVEDVTAQRDASQRLAQSERHLRRLYESTPAMLHSVDSQGRMLTVSDRWLAVMGCTREQVIGRQSVEFLTEASRDHVSRMAVPEFLRTGRMDGVQMQLRTGRGELLDILQSAIIDGDVNDASHRRICVSEDVTERLRDERALRDERRRMAFILEGTGAGTWEWNVATGEARFNDIWAGIVGYTLEQLAPLSVQTWLTLSHPEDLVRSGALLQAHFGGAQPAYECEVRMRHREGHWVWILARGKVLTWLPDGSPEWMFGTYLDLTERKGHETALRKSEYFLNRTNDVAGVGGWEYDFATDTMLASATVRRLYGVEADVRLDRAAAIQFFPPEERGRIMTTMEAAILAQTGWDIETALIRSDGQRFWVRFVGSVESEDGVAVRTVGAFQDITRLVEQREALERANERVALAADSGGIGIWGFDPHSGTVTLDAWGRRAYGFPETQAPVTAGAILSRIMPADRPAFIAAVRDAVADTRALDIEFRVVWVDGSLHHLRATARRASGDDGCLVGANWDVTALRQLSAQVAEQHELLSVTLQSIGDAVVTTDATGRVTWLNPVAERMTGWLAVEARGRPLAQVFHIVNEATREPAENPIAVCLARGETVGLAGNTLLIARDGTEYGIEDSAAPIRNAAGELLGGVLVFHDVTEQRRLAGEMSYRATHDALTGLVNRAEFEARLGRSLKKAQESGIQHALMFIDLDQFKLVNDACGHSAGDQLLQQVSKLLTETVRSRDTLARLGGDEFAVILEHCTAEQAQRVAQEICDRMDDFRFVHEARRFRIGASIGLVPVDSRWAAPAALLQAADTSCYAAKEAGRNRVHVWFDTDLAMRARHGETKWATRLEQALDEDRFVLFAQRIEPIALGPQAAHGLHAEALLRLVDTDGSLVAPGSFLPAAERFHFSSRIDRWVLRHAIDHLIGMGDLSGVSTLCINLSGQSVGDRAFHRQAIGLLTEAGDAVCRRVCLEITETAAITNLTDAALFIEQVRQLGVRIALDDFGAGASSFGYLKSLAVDMVKIDGQFIRDLLEDPLDDAAVRCFVDVARVLGVKTVAEFVDRPEVLVRLREIGVDYAQGFLLHRPEPIAAVLAAVPALAH